jgi:hypothetical protein
MPVEVRDIPDVPDIEKAKVLTDSWGDRKFSTVKNLGGRLFLAGRVTLKKRVPVVFLAAKNVEGSCCYHTTLSLPSLLKNIFSPQPSIMRQHKIMLEVNVGV